MKEIRNIISSYEAVDWSKNKAALATVVSVEESAYRRIGARMFVKSSGDWIGGISGGCLEGDALKRAQIAIHKDTPSVVVYDTMDDDAHQIGVGLGCNGRIEVLFVPIDHEDNNNPIEQLKQLTQRRQPILLYQLIDTSDNTNLGLVSENLSAIANTIIAEEAVLREMVESVKLKRKSKVYELKAKDASNHSILIEFLRPELKLILVGDNYDVNAFVGIADELGWDIQVIGLLRKIGKHIFDKASKVVSYDQASDITVDEYTAVVLMSHDYDKDMAMLQHFLKNKPTYMGMLGPKKRTIKMQNDLKKTIHDIDLDELQLFYSPVGLDIGAESPEEIALSITAEIVAAFRNRDGKFLRNRIGTIHERD